MRVLIVDDESAARRRLQLMLEELDVEVAGEATNGLEALATIRDNRPDVVLLDIEMPEIDGLDVARHMPEPRPFLIFQTAYDEYALDAFEHAALDYLVKPVSLDKLERALARARERLQAGKSEAPGPELMAALRNAVRPGRQPRILVRDRGGHRLVALREILRFTTEAGGVWAMVGRERFLTDYTLAELEERATSGFVRVSRGDLVNLETVRRIEGPGDGSGWLELADGSRVRVSRRRWQDVRDQLEA
jgi:DNA-binding LytR/AlgR family response regulator